MSQSQLTDESPTHPDDELLVAYLDGELDRETRTGVEDRLMEDETLRKRLGNLQTGWDMLDAIATPDTEASLVESTLELAIADLAGQAQGVESPKQNWTWPIAFFAVAALFGVGGVLFADFQRHRAFEEELQDLAIAEDLDAYSHGGNLELMRLLSANSDWVQLASTARELANPDSQTKPLYQIPTEKRTAAIEETPVGRRVQLQSRLERWQRFDEETQSTIRRSANAAWSQDDHESLIKTMRAYAIWREQLPSDLVDEIESSDDKIRRQAIGVAIEQSKSELVRSSGAQLEDEAIERIYFVLQHLLDERFERDPSRYKRFKEFRKRVAPALAKWGAIRFSFASEDPFRGRTTRGTSGFRRDFKPMSDHEKSAIRLVLSDELLDRLMLLAGGDQMLEEMALQIWVDEAIRRKYPYNDDQSLLQRYRELEAAEREVIDLLPPDRMLQSLSRERP